MSTILKLWRNEWVPESWNSSCSTSWNNFYHHIHQSAVAIIKLLPYVHRWTTTALSGMAPGFSRAERALRIRLPLSSTESWLPSNWRWYLAPSRYYLGTAAKTFRWRGSPTQQTRSNLQWPWPQSPQNRADGTIASWTDDSHKELWEIWGCCLVNWYYYYSVNRRKMLFKESYFYLNITFIILLSHYYYNFYYILYYYHCY